MNLKAELEILGLHEKLDELRETKWDQLIESADHDSESRTGDDGCEGVYGGGDGAQQN